MTRPNEMKLPNDDEVIEQFLLGNPLDATANWAVRSMKQMGDLLRERLKATLQSQGEHGVCKHCGRSVGEYGLTGETLGHVCIAGGSLRERIRAIIFGSRFAGGTEDHDILTDHILAVVALYRLNSIPVKIYVNGVEHETRGETISYEQVAEMAGKQGVYLTVAYYSGEGEGSLIPGETAPLRYGMKFVAVYTGRA